MALMYQLWHELGTNNFYLLDKSEEAPDWLIAGATICWEVSAPTEADVRNNYFKKMGWPTGREL